MSRTRRLLLTLAGADLLVGSAACARRSPSQASVPGADSVQIGYGSQPRSKVTGAVTSVADAEMTARPLRIEELLRGKVSGLVITGSGSSLVIRLRGTNSLLSDQEPLVIVDDVMIQSGNIGNALAGLTPDDIKQVSVLKDVASTSIYGSRGAGGVILIKTKTKPEGKERTL
jgi:TonB-dependent starch-binding outer membrane protein SusC